MIAEPGRIDGCTQGNQLLADTNVAGAVDSDGGGEPALAHVEECNGSVSRGAALDHGITWQSNTGNL